MVPVPIEYLLRLEHYLGDRRHHRKFPIAGERGRCQVLIHDHCHRRIDHQEFGVREAELRARPSNLDTMGNQLVPDVVLVPTAPIRMLFEHHPHLDTSIRCTCKSVNHERVGKEVDRKIDRAGSSINLPD